MQVSEAKKLKVGDKVKIKRGSTYYVSYVPGMKDAIGQSCTVISEYDRHDNDVKVELQSLIGQYDTMFFSPSWLEKIEDGVPKDTPVSVKNQKEHPKAEVLRWIADGKNVEYRSPGGVEFHLLDTSHNFCIFESSEYRICTDPEKYKKYQVLCQHSDGNYFILPIKYTKENASKFGDFVKVLE